MLMLKNSELREIGRVLEEAGSVLLFPHINPDGDCMGSCIALCHALRGLGKEAWVLIENDLPDHLAWIDDGSCTKDKAVLPDPDVTMCVDCCEEKRFPGRVKAFRSGKATLCIDHHRLDECGWDRYYIDPEAAATAEIVFDLMKECGWAIDEETARALFVGICSDTGGFRYSNTTPGTHRIAAELMECGVDVYDINVRLFQSVDLREIKVIRQALDTMDVFAGGKAAMACLSEEDRLSCGARIQDTESVINWLRDIRGVQIAAFLKEDGGRIRVSFRAKNEGNVAAIAAAFGGGGHIKAAGCTMDESLESARAKLKKAIEDSLK